LDGHSKAMFNLKMKLFLTLDVVHSTVDGAEDMSLSKPLLSHLDQ